MGEVAPERRIKIGENLAARDRRLIRLFIGGIGIAAIGGMLCAGLANPTARDRVFTAAGLASLASLLWVLGRLTLRLWKARRR